MQSEQHQELNSNVNSTSFLNPQLPFPAICHSDSNNKVDESLVQTNASSFCGSWTLTPISHHLVQFSPVLKPVLARQPSTRVYLPDFKDHLKRTEILDYCHSVWRASNYSLKTYYLYIEYINAFMSCYSVGDSQKQLIGFIALRMASKMEEISTSIPSITNCVEYFDYRIPAKKLIDMEFFFFNFLNFNLNLKTPYTFLIQFYSEGFIYEGDLIETQQMAHPNKVISLAKDIGYHMLEVTSQHYEFCQFSSNVVAGSILALTRSCMKLPAWRNELTILTSLELSYYFDCILQLIPILLSEHPEIYGQFFSKIQFFECQIRSILRDHSELNKDQFISRTPVGKNREIDLCSTRSDENALSYKESMFGGRVFSRGSFDGSVGSFENQIQETFDLSKVPRKITRRVSEHLFNSN